MDTRNQSLANGTKDFEVLCCLLAAKLVVLWLSLLLSPAPNSLSIDFFMSLAPHRRMEEDHGRQVRHLQVYLHVPKSIAELLCSWNLDGVEGHNIRVPATRV